MTAAKDTFFSPTKVSAMEKAASTHKVAMQIIDAEAAAREKKTERLRRLRMERQALEPEAETPPKRSKRKA